MLPSVQAGYVAAQCAAGSGIDYHTYPGRDHVGVVDDDSPLIDDLVRWTQDRIDGTPVSPACLG